MNIAHVEAWLSGLASKDRRAYRALTYTCSGCGNVVLEVFVRPVSVIVTRRAKRHPNAPPVPSANATVEERIAYNQQHRADLHGSDEEIEYRSLADPLPDPADAHNELIFSTCRCRRGGWTLGMYLILTDLAAGIPDRVLDDPLRREQVQQQTDNRGRHDEGERVSRAAAGGHEVP